jgi:very-short-patch-repair endonuclease
MPTPIDSIIAGAAESIGAIAQRFIAGELSAAQWAREMQVELARNWAASFKAGLGEKPTRAQEKWLEREYNKHNRFVRQFADDLAAAQADGTLSEAQVLNRANMYADRLRGLYEAGTAAAHDLVLPFTPGSGHTQCFYDAYHVTVLTQERGFINLPEVKAGMHVLSHKGRFCEVLEHIHLPGTGEGIEVSLSYGGKPGRTFAVTPDHLFAVTADDGMTWMRADMLLAGQTMPRMGKHCELPGCENVFDLLVGRDARKRFCGPTCSNRFDVGRRTAAAHEAIRQQVLDNNSPLQRWRREHPEQVYEAARRAGTIANARHPKTGKTYEQLYGTEQAVKTRAKLAKARRGKTLEEIFGSKVATKVRESNRARMNAGHAKRMRAAVKNPSAVKGRSMIERFGQERADSIKNKLSEATKRQWREHGDEMLERLAQAREDRGAGLPSGNRTKPERIMASILGDLGIAYKEQVWFLGRFCVDFYLPKHGMVLEADGDYWHNYPEGLDGDRERDALIKQKKGMDTFRFWEKDLERNATSVKEQIARIAANHAGLFQTIQDVAVVSTKRVHPKGDVQCLVVADDHSFVVSDGLISHNCLTNCKCYLSYEKIEDEQVAIWNLTPAEHCEDCLALASKPHTEWRQAIGA